MLNSLDIRPPASQASAKKQPQVTVVSRPESRSANYWTQQDEIVVVKPSCFAPIVSFGRGLLGLQERKR